MVRNDRLFVHCPCDNADFPELDFAEVADAVLIVVKHNRVIADGEFAQNAVMDQRLHIPAESGITDFGAHKKAFCILAEFGRNADWQQTIVMPGQDFHSSDALGDGLREGTRLNNVAAAVDIGEHSTIAGECALFIVKALQFKLHSFILGLCALVLYSPCKGAFPCAFPHALGIIRRRYPQICNCQLRRHSGVIVCNIGRSRLGTVPGKLCVHAVQQVFQLECFLFEVNADVLCSTSCIFSREYHSHALLYLL